MDDDCKTAHYECMEDWRGGTYQRQVIQEAPSLGQEGACEKPKPEGMILKTSDYAATA